MADVALIAGAGWKGAACRLKAVPPKTPDFLLPLIACPELLLPLGDGTTVLSRVADQLQDRGFSLFVSVGKPGCLFPTAAMHYGGRRTLITKEAFGIGRTVSPWTAERVRYVQQFGCAVEQANPDVGNCHTSFYSLLDAAGKDWDRWLLLCGDMVFSDALLDEMLSYARSCWFRLKDQVLLLDRQGVDDYKRAVAAGGTIRSYDGGMVDKVRVQSLYSSGRRGAVRFVDKSSLSHSEECVEVDHTFMYPEALEWIRNRDA
jgi:hypothetical protein